MGNRIRFRKIVNIGIVIAVDLTFTVVMGFLGPLYGYASMFRGANLLFHMIIPVVSMAEIILLSDEEYTKRDNNLTVIPPLIYGTGYRVFGNDRKMAMLTGEDQDYEAIADADFVFAMITMISKDEILQRFDKNYFGTIVIDEVHHASAASYQKVMNYFNEGVDLPEINQVIMLRPTQSAIVFIQQLGRGLRKQNDKEYVVILDFIGNYSNNFLIPIALSGDRTYNKDNMRKYLMEGSGIIPGCSTIHFDEISRQSIFKAIDRATTPLKFLKERYNALRDRLGRMPTATEFYRFGDIDPILFTEYNNESYYSFARKYDKDCGLEDFTDRQRRTLDYISTQIVNGKRPHELIILQELIEHNEVDRDIARQRLEEYGLKFRETDYDSAIRILDKTFLNTQGDKAKYDQVILLDRYKVSSSNQVRRCSSYLNALMATSDADRQFISAMKDLIEFGLMRNRDWFNGADEDGWSCIRNIHGEISAVS